MLAQTAQKPRSRLFGLALSGLAAVLVSHLFIGAVMANTERRIDDDRQESLAITIYNADLALIKDRRRVQIESGEQRLAWRNVSEKIRPETALLSEVEERVAINLLEQNFDFDLLTPESLLKKYVGRTVQVIRTNDAGERDVEDAIVLAVNQQPILHYSDRIEAGVVGHLAFPDVPEDLRDQPTLVLHLESPTGGEGLFELSYLSGGLSWKADYVANLSAAGDLMDLNGWVTLTNASGVAYRQAQVQLVAGELNLVREEAKPFAVMRSVTMMADAMPEEESLAEYHLYTLPRSTDLLNNQTKQVALLSAPGVPVVFELSVRGQPYLYQTRSIDGWATLPVKSSLRFENQGGSLGIPLPKGVVRVYAKDRRGHAQFVGEDAISHTPRNETLRLELGESFDVTARRRQSDFKKLAGTSAHDYLYEAAFEMELKNAKDETVEVKVVETFPGDWRMLSESHPHTKEASNLASWTLSIPPQGSTSLTWRVQVKH